MAKYHYVHYLWKSVRGDPEHFDIFGYFLKMNKFGANNQQGIHSSYRSTKSGINKRKLSHLFFLIYQNYLVALIMQL